VSVTFEFDGLEGFFDTTPEEIWDPRDGSSTGFYDYRGSRRVDDQVNGWQYPAMRLWMIGDASQTRGPANLVVPGTTYAADELPFGYGDDPGQVVFYVEGVNQVGGTGSALQPIPVRVNVTAGDDHYDDTVWLTVVEANLGVNNSNHDPFRTDEDPQHQLRPGIPDVEWLIDEYDEIVEDQNGGFHFWRKGDKLYDAVDLFPVLVTIPGTLDHYGFQFYLRIEDAVTGRFRAFQNASPSGDLLGYLKSLFIFDKSVGSSRTNFGEHWVWKLPPRTNGDSDSYLLSPMSLADIGTDQTFKMQLVAKDRSGNKIVVDSFEMTLYPMIWKNWELNNVFWMTSTRGEPSGEYQYTADTIGGEPVSQGIPIYPVASQTSGPNPDSKKENYLIFVHGYNINPDRAFKDAAEFFKRAWWAGYRGTYVGFTWEGDEYDPFGHTCEGLPEWMSGACAAAFFPNMANAFQTSPRFKELIEDQIIGGWGANPENINVVAHSLGNLVVMDALRLFSVEHPTTNEDEILFNSLLAVEAAVWEEAFWSYESVDYRADLSVGIDQLLSASWAFWFNQPTHPLSFSCRRVINSFAAHDKALKAMRINDYYPYIGRRCLSPAGPCPREERLSSRGMGSQNRLPIFDGFQVAEDGNMADLSYEIPAMLSKSSGGYLLRGHEDLTKPIGMGSINHVIIKNVNSVVFDWDETEHSDFLRERIQRIWPWFDRVFSNDYEFSILGNGRE
jgi:hypothetical protein